METVTKHIPSHANTFKKQKFGTGAIFTNTQKTLLDVIILSVMNTPYLQTFQFLRLSVINLKLYNLLD